MSYKGYNQAMNEATQKYRKANLDQLAIRIPKGDRDIYKEYAQQYFGSIPKMIVTLIHDDMRKRGVTPPERSADASQDIQDK